MKEASDGDGGGSSNDVPSSRAADSTVSNGKVNGPISMVASQPRRLLSDRPPAMGVTLASLGAEVANSGLACATMSEHGNLPLGGTTLANALLGITLEVNRGSNGSSSNNGDTIIGGIHSTNSTSIGKGIKSENNGQNRGEKPYHCSHCERQFVQVANLRRHLRVHTGERPYACTLCSSRFSDSNQLKAHLLIHKGEKPYQCDKCKGRFRRRHHLVHHKCPKDEANIGKPRRGRRPKAYDQLPPSILSPVFKEHLTPSIPDLPPHPPSVAMTSVITRKPSPQPMQQPPVAHMHQVRRNHVQMLQHHVPQNINGKFHDTIQTGPLDMTVSSVPNNSVSVIVPRIPPKINLSYRNNLRMEGVLDLSNSRSDSDAEPIEEEVDEEDEVLDSESEDDERRHLPLISCTWKKEDLCLHHHPDDLQRGNGERYESEGENSNLALQLTT
ncbi:hypothetical protein NPIL_534121 [Nephila pilipes]|uniref:C2H2-type domain-containing protein n=1 Tax=Nephila pilipes TaxID=299642 RepID=A0A8X6P6T8_NEPPI|nr:hypothetical protein NPIL_534121 [Nephila pilipes]